MSSDSHPEQEARDVLREEVFENGGVVKKVYREGSGKCPTKGSKVHVHYVGTLENGTQFDSSRDRGTPFVFDLGIGRVIKAWDLGVASMRPGELCQLVCKPEFAYGEREQGNIPPNSTLYFEVELLSWDNKSPVTPDNLVMREVLVEADDWLSPNPTSVCKVKYLGRLVGVPEDNADDDEEGRRGKVFDEQECITVRLGETIEVVLGVHKALEKMKKGERAGVWVDPLYGYGEAGNKELAIPPNAKLYYEVELLEYEKGTEKWSMTEQEKVDLALRRKEVGNALFKLGRFFEAYDRYQYAIDIWPDWKLKDTSGADGFDSESDDDDGVILADEAAPADDAPPKPKGKIDRTVVKKLVAQLNSNAGTCQSKMNNPVKALEHWKKATEYDPSNVKAQYFMARACAERGDDDEALERCNAALEMDADNAAVLALKKVVKKRLAKAEKKQRSIFKNMFDKVDLTSEPKQGDEVDFEEVQEDGADADADMDGDGDADADPATEE